MEFYIKSLDDPNFDPYKLQSESEIAQLLAQIELVLFTNKGDVLGNPGFGCSLEDLVYEFTYNAGQIEAEINTQMLLFVPLAQKYDVKTTVEFLSGTQRDAIFIDVVIDSRYQVQVVI